MEYDEQDLNSINIFFDKLDSYLDNKEWSHKNITCRYACMSQIKAPIIKHYHYNSINSEIFGSEIFKITASVDLDLNQIEYLIICDELSNRDKIKIQNEHQLVLSGELLLFSPNDMADVVHDSFLDIVKDVYDLLDKSICDIPAHKIINTQQKKKPDYEVDENDSLYKFYDYNNKLIKQHGNLIEQSVRRKRVSLFYKAYLYEANLTLLLFVVILVVYILFYN